MNSVSVVELHLPTGKVIGMSDLETDKAIREVLAGNADAFYILLRRYSLPVRGFINARIYSRDDADDIVQDIFITAYERLSTYRQEDSFQAWLFGISRNKLLHYFRTKKRNVSAMDRFQAAVWEEVSPRVEALTEDVPTERLELLMECIHKLPEKLRRIVTAELKEEKLKDLAVEMQTSSGTIYTLHWRAMGLLRACMSAS